MAQPEHDVAGHGDGVGLADAALLLEELRGIHALDVLDREVELAVGLAVVIGRDDVRVIEPGDGHRFPFEAP